MTCKIYCWMNLFLQLFLDLILVELCHYFFNWVLWGKLLPRQLDLHHLPAFRRATIRLNGTFLHQEDHQSILRLHKLLMYMRPCIQGKEFK
jgi:hypothetical protein